MFLVRYERGINMKRQNLWTIADCTRIIKENKDNTNYFNRSITQDAMWDMLRNRMYFGEAETAVIIAALIKAGAKFKMKGENK